MLEDASVSAGVGHLRNFATNMLSDICLRYWTVNTSWLHRCTIIKYVLVVSWTMVYSIRREKLLYLGALKIHHTFHFISCILGQTQSSGDTKREEKSLALFFTFVPYSRRKYCKNSDYKSSGRPEICADTYCRQHNIPQRCPHPNPWTSV